MSNKRNNLKITKFLIERGASLEIKDINYTNLLLLAFEKKYISMIYLILNTIKKQVKKEININEKNKQGDTPIILAIKMKNLELFKTLFEMLEMEGTIEKDLLFRICEFSNIGFLQYCLSEEFQKKYKIEYDLDEVNSIGASLLHFAAKNCDKKICEFLLENGNEINLPDNEGKTPIIYSLRENADIKFIQFLIRRGAKIPEDLYEEALIAGADKVISYLIEKGINVNRRMKKGETGLEVLSLNSQNLKIAELLLKHGYYINKELKNSNNQILLKAIKSKGRNQDYIEFLIEQGANFDTVYILIKNEDHLKKNKEIYGKQ